MFSNACSLIFELACLISGILLHCGRKPEGFNGVESEEMPGPAGMVVGIAERY